MVKTLAEEQQAKWGEGIAARLWSEQIRMERLRERSRDAFLAGALFGSGEIRTTWNETPHERFLRAGRVAQEKRRSR